MTGISPARSVWVRSFGFRHIGSQGRIPECPRRSTVTITWPTAPNAAAIRGTLYLPPPAGVAHTRSSHSDAMAILLRDGGRDGGINPPLSNTTAFDWGWVIRRARLPEPTEDEYQDGALV